MNRLLLKDGWQLAARPLSDGRDTLAAVLREPETWYDCSVPCDVMVPLIEAGVLPEPTVADNCFACEWVEKRSWWFRRAFRGDELPGWEDADAVELVFASLDLVADVFLNGVWLGSHRSVHYEFRREVRRLLVPGENVLAVRLTVGLETVTDADLAEIDWAVCVEGERHPDRGDMRRAFLRKPQYVFGWDWSPRIATCGIMDEVALEVHKTVAVRGVSLATERADAREAVLHGELEIESFHPLRTRDADVAVSLSFGGAQAATVEVTDILLCSGTNYVPFTVRIRDPRLWWPNGMGEQALYDVDIAVQCGGGRVTHPTFAFGVRTVTLDCHRVDAERRHFALVVNGVEIFCKGGDWVPPDPLYSRVTDAKLTALVAEAKAANFNTLRIWGGGCYNREPFYRACDEAGILLWHDFMFACSTYPDHLPWFAELCERELDYQTRRLRNHACIGLFCGNNENHEIFNWEANPHWGMRVTPERQYGLAVSNKLAPAAIRRNCPQIPYWNSSPYGGRTPPSQEVGDVHYWGNAMMNADMARRIDPAVYDEVTARFVSEYGYPGPTCLATIRDYHGGAPVERGSRVWNLHNNTFEKDTVEAGIRRHYTDEPLSLEDYILYAGMTQGTLLGYSLEAFRFKTFCCGGVFWMYNDCWGEVGWTIVDSYLRRKIAFYAVARAFAPVRLMLRAEGGAVTLVGANDGEQPLAFDAEIGWISFDGTVRETAVERLTLPARGRAVLRTDALPGRDPALGCFAVVPIGVPVAPAVLRQVDARVLRLVPDAVRVESVRDDGADRVLTVTAGAYAHGVRLVTDRSCSDNYFELVPGETRDVRVFGGAGETVEVKTVL